MFIIPILFVDAILNRVLPVTLTILRCDKRPAFLFRGRRLIETRRLLAVLR